MRPRPQRGPGWRKGGDHISSNRFSYENWTLQELLMGVETPIPPKMINAAAPDGAPPRRIRTVKKKFYRFLSESKLRYVSFNVVMKKLRKQQVCVSKAIQYRRLQCDKAL
jgi:hypothetical protein